MELLHFTGPVWRPPFEAQSQLLQVTAGCTWRKCKFCSLYHGTKFSISLCREIEVDLRVIRQYQPRTRRLFLTGGNPFALSYDRLLELALKVRSELSLCRSIGCFARVTDIRRKTVDQLKALRHVGYDGLSIGVESGDDATLTAMNKGYVSADILEQCGKLDEAGIRYHFTYLVGLAGKGGGEQNARRTAEVFNCLHPVTVNLVSLTLFPEAALWSDREAGLFTEAPERERLQEVRTLIERLKVPATMLGNTVSNVVPIVGLLPMDRARMLRELDEALDTLDEQDMADYRRRIKSL